MTPIRDLAKRAALRAAFLAFLLPAAAMPAAAAGPDVTPLMSADWLAGHVDAPQLIVLDLRSASAFERGHVPGAIQSAFPGRWNAEADGVPSRLPDVSAIEAYLTELGITNDSTVVIVSAGIGINDLTASTWVYWVLKYVGLDRVAILDGGWDQWFYQQLPTETGAAAPVAGGAFVATPRPEILADTDYVANQLGGAAFLVDARPTQQYTGASAPAGLVTRAGHIPGAINVPNSVFYDASLNRFAPVETLRQQVPAQLADPAALMIVYCSTGQASSMSWFVFHELLGYQDVRLYEASMAAWTRRDDLPMVTGPDP